MPTPPKPFTVLSAEKKSHRTKAELNQRKKEEEALITGEKLKERREVRENEIAHKEFIRVNKLLKKIEKNDAIYEAVINRYCLLQAECVDFEIKIESTNERLETMDDDAELDCDVRYRLICDLSKTLVNLDKQLQAKRKMLFDLEKENIMTIASSLRSIPKKVDSKANPLLQALGGE